MRLKGRATALGIVLLGLILWAWGWWISREPPHFDVRTRAETAAAAEGVTPVPGFVLTTTLIEVVRTLLEKPGGYLSNDVTPPGVWLDNMPNWEFGVLVQLRDLAQALRNEMSRSQSQSQADPDLEVAEPQFNFDSESWLFPATESEYRKGIRALERYRRRLADPQRPEAQFFARADNLAEYLKRVEVRLGALSQRLAASVGQRRVNTDLAGDPSARQATPTPREQVVKTPWLEIDDVFYEARGATWALLHFMQAIRIDFASVLDDKNAAASLEQIIRELEGAQRPLCSPVVLNGSGYGLLANHSLTLASFISRANAAVIDLRRLLVQG